MVMLLTQGRKPTNTSWRERKEQTWASNDDGSESKGEEG